MEPDSFQRGRRIFGVIAGLGWFALVLQFILMLMMNPLSLVGVGKAMLLFGSFFTIVSNTIVAILSTRLAVGHPLSASLNRWAAAGAVWITIVAVVWLILLRGTYPLGGAGAISDALMHEIIPPTYVIAWAWLLPKGRLRWGDAAKWLFLPLGYAAWMFGRGAIDGWYPYPFLNVTAIGYPRAGGVTLVLIAAFYAVGLLFVAADRWMAISSRPAE